jgi:hypothetical protein
LVLCIVDAVVLRRSDQLPDLAGPLKVQTRSDHYHRAR